MENSLEDQMMTTEKSPCIMCVQYRGVFSTVGDIMSTVGVFSTVGDILSTVGDIMSTVGGYLEYRGGVQYRGDIMSTLEGVQYREGKSFVI